MSSVNEHYECLLSQHYTWMFGTSFEERVKDQKVFLSRTLESLPNPIPRRLGVDLGCGPGFQTIALAELGFSPVVAIDTSAELLNELRSHAGSLPIRTETADLRDLPAIVQAGQATVIVCMGDTLPHLPQKSAVSDLFRSVFDRLRQGGVFVITYRDLTKELFGTDRFIPVRTDENKIMTCFLEFENADSVVVHDLVHVRQDSGWSLSKSSYRKLRLGIGWVREELSKAGFDMLPEELSGRLIGLAAVKP
jgi:SAM-dependent methyltransferase